MDTLNNLELTILRILEAHQGKGNAIGRIALVDQINREMPLFPVNEREVRDTKSHLITQHGYAIGSCHDGYFLCTTPSEIEEVAKYYERYGLSSFFVASRLKKTEMRDYLGQMSLKF